MLCGYSLILYPEFCLYFELNGDLMLVHKAYQPISSNQPEECLFAQRINLVSARATNYMFYVQGLIFSVSKHNDRLTFALI